jgi:tRNA nucleotidyltransferase (CCA-adding enzyme)
MYLQIPTDVSTIIDTLKTYGFNAHAVGGCVRDSLLKRQPNDWDITTDALPQDIISIFPHTVPTGIKHGTVTVILNNAHFEVTTYRIDGDYSDGRHPDSVVFTNSLESDLSRRDFTINAIAYNHDSGLSDPFEGMKDLALGIVRCVGNAHERFNEDALRMIRAVRFANQLDFKVDNETLEAVKENSSLILKVSIERIREELCKILLCKKPSYGMLLLLDSGLLQHIMPEIMPCIDFNQCNPHHNKDVFSHSLAVLDNSPGDLIIRLAALLHDIGKPDSFSKDEKGIGHFYGHEDISYEKSEAFLRRFKFDNNTIKRVSALVKEHMSKYNNPKNLTVKRLINRVGAENIDALLELQIADIKGSAEPERFENIEKLKLQVHTLLQEKCPLSTKDLALNGTDLIALGFKPGKLIGEILAYLLDIILEAPELNSKEQLLQLVKDKYKVD